MKMIRVIVEGRVQGVCFRDYTRRQARQLNLTGWVRNRRDGSVETVLRGAEHNVTTMLESLRQGPPLSKVDNLCTSEVTMDEEYTTFEVRRG